MNQTPEEFDPLRKLLRWKNQEQPYPAYFDRFSNQVMSRIRARQSISPPSRWLRFLEFFDARPVMAGAYALLVLGMMLFVFGFNELGEASLDGLPPYESSMVNSLVPLQEMTGLSEEQSLAQPIAPTYRLATPFPRDLFMPVEFQPQFGAFYTRDAEFRIESP